jgi:hypothetical protein
MIQAADAVTSFLALISLKSRKPSLMAAASGQAQTAQPCRKVFPNLRMSCAPFRLCGSVVDGTRDQVGHRAADPVTFTRRSLRWLCRATPDNEAPFAPTSDFAGASQLLT